MSDTKKGFRLTEQQEKYLNSLVCQRLSDDEANRQCIAEILAEAHNGITDALIKGWNQDKKDKLAFYLVKDPKDNLPMMFFSLKCGEIADPLNLEKKRKKLEYSEALFHAAMGLDAPEWAVKVVEMRKVDGVLPPKKLQEFRNRYVRDKRESDNYWGSFAEEFRVEGDNIIRTHQTFAGVELVHFYVHRPARSRWRSEGMNSRSIGRTLFWKFAVPIIQSVRELVGLEYLYLFAADQSRTRKLTKYYKEMGFEIRKDLNVSKPEYDFSCIFMCQKVVSLRNRGQEFFREYNNPVDPHELEL